MNQRDLAIESCVNMLKELESDNDHTGALILACTLMCFHDYAIELEAIQSQHIMAGHLTDELHKRREHLRQLIREKGKLHEDWVHYKNFV